MPGPSSVCSLASAVDTSVQLGPNIQTSNGRDAITLHRFIYRVRQSESQKPL